MALIFPYSLVRMVGIGIALALCCVSRFFRRHNTHARTPASSSTAAETPHAIAIVVKSPFGSVPGEVVSNDGLLKVTVAVVVGGGVVVDRDVVDGRLLTVNIAVVVGGRLVIDDVVDGGLLTVNIAVVVDGGVVDGGVVIDRMLKANVAVVGGGVVVDCDVANSAHVGSGSLPSHVL
jgi:hypothetical protein